MTTLASTDEFRIAARAGRASGLTVQRLASAAVSEVSGRLRTLRFCFSDGTIDRAGDSIDPNGWELTEFRANPVALWAHMATEPPIGRVIDVGLVKSRLMGDIEFADAATYEFADTIYRLAKGGFINAVSVGFQPIEWSFASDKERPFGIDFKRQALLEASIVPVPCNANALIEARAKGINTAPLTDWARRIVGSGGAPSLQRAELERQWAGATLY